MSENEVMLIPKSECVIATKQENASHIPPKNMFERFE